MIAYISGKIAHKSPTHLIIEVSGIGYLVKISLNTYAKVQSLDQVSLFTSLVVRVEMQTVSGFDLYGFFDEQEKDIFEKLLSVSGVGASTARIMLSSFQPEEIRQAILTENVALVQSAKGIGPKTAKRIILDLKDKLGKMDEPQLISISSHNTLKDEALSALTSLGFQKALVDKVLAKLIQSNAHWTVELLIKESLKQL